MLIMGIDPGTVNLGYGLIDTANNGVTIRDFGTIRLRRSDFSSMYEHIDCMGKNVRLFTESLKPDEVVMEDFVEQGINSGKNYKEMAYIIEHLRLILRSLGYEAYIYSNGFWKKQTLKASKASKTQIKHYVSNNIPGASEALKNESTHVWDSVCIAYCRYMILRREKLVSSCN